MAANPDPRIFVFGSNLAGRHGKGAALHARKNFGAIYGLGAGFQGQSYAIPTKDYDLRTLGLESIKTYVEGFLFFARAHSEMRFNVTRIGCGLAGYSDWQIAPMFKDAPPNCELPLGWRSFSQSSDRSPEAFAKCEVEEARAVICDPKNSMSDPASHSPAVQELCASIQFEVVKPPKSQE